MTGPTLAVITGGNSGLGFETARNLVAMSPDNTVILACRSIARGAEAQRAITESTRSTRVRAMELDLASMASVRAFAAQCITDLPQPIDALICNAGISRGSGATVDGVDPVFATDHLGHFLLTLSLLTAMAPTGRVLSVSSDMHAPPGPGLVWPGAEALADPTRAARIGSRRYSFAKLCNIYFIHELSQRLRASGSGVSAAAFNPGLMTETNFATMPRLVGTMLKAVVRSRVGRLDTSSAALADLAAGRGAAEIDGQYFDRTAAHSTPSSDVSSDERNARDLWELSARLTGIDL